MPERTRKTTRKPMIDLKKNIGFRSFATPETADARFLFDFCGDFPWAGGRRTGVSPGRPDGRR